MASVTISYQNSRNYLWMFWTFVVFVCGLIVWANVFSLNKSVVVSGVLQPYGLSYQVESARDGRVVKISVDVGEKVAAGQTVMVLDTELDELNLRALQNNLSVAKLKLQRFKALADKVETFPTTLVETGELWENERQNFIAAQSSFDAEVAVLQKEIDVSTLRMENVNQKILANLSQRSLLEKQQVLVSSLFEKGFEGELSVLEINLKIENFDEQIRSLRSSVAEEKIRLETLIKRQKSLERNFFKQARQGVYEANVEIRQLSEQIFATSRKIKQSTLTSPTTGRISRVLVPNTGQFVRLGEAVADVVPLSVPLMLYIKIPAEHISSVAISQDVLVSLSNMDSQNSQKLEGLLVQIDGDATVDDRGFRYFEGIVKIDDIEEKIAVPGVQGTAALTIGSRTVLEYFLEPILERLGNSFSE